MTSCGNPHILLKNKESDKVEKEHTEYISVLYSPNVCMVYNKSNYEDLSLP